MSLDTITTINRSINQGDSKMSKTTTKFEVINRFQVGDRVRAKYQAGVTGVIISVNKKNTVAVVHYDNPKVWCLEHGTFRTLDIVLDGGAA
jgi:hypothetical protein